MNPPKKTNKQTNKQKKHEKQTQQTLQDEESKRVFYFEISQNRYSGNNWVNYH